MINEAGNNKVNELPDILSDYLESFEEKSNDLNEKISSLESEIKELKSTIKDNQKKLKEKVTEIDSKKKNVNIKLHGVSGDYEVDQLIKAAETLKDLEAEKEEIEENIKEETDELSLKIKELEEEKSNASSVKEKVDDLKSDTKTKLKESYDENKKKLDAINKALEISDNENLKLALKEEKEAMQNALDEIFVESQKLLGEKVDLLTSEEEPEIVNSSLDEIKFEDKKEEPVEIENPEPNFTEIEEEPIDINIEEPVEDFVVPFKTFEDVVEESEKVKKVYDETREIINKVDASKKAELVKGSNQVRKSLEIYFS